MYITQTSIQINYVSF